MAAICSLVSTSFACLASASDTALDRLLDAALEGHRVGAGGHVAQPFADQRLGQHGRGGRAVTGDVVGLLRYFLDQLGADLLVGVLELDLLGDADSVVGDRGCAPLLLQHDVAALGAERHLHGVGENVHAALEAAAGLLVERDHLGHLRRPLPRRADYRHCSDRPAMTAAARSPPWGFHPTRLALAMASANHGLALARRECKRGRGAVRFDVERTTSRSRPRPDGTAKESARACTLGVRVLNRS